MANNPVTQNMVKLRVAEASQDDAYKGIARIDYDTMKILGLRRGDVVSVKGGRETLAIVDRAYPADVNEGIVRIDGIIRKNAKTGVGEIVELKKSDIKEAKKVTIAPVQENIVVQGDPEIFRRGLLGRAVLKGDIVVLGGVQRRKDLMSEELGEFGDIFGDILGGFGMNFAGFQQIKFLIVNTTPAQPAVITENTEVVVNSKAVEVSDDRVFDVTYEDIGGLTEETKKVREMIELPLKHPEIFERLGVEPPKGVLLHGPPGTGKTLLAKAVANETDANFILLNGPEIMCVSGETQILTNPKGYIKAEQIYEEKGSTEKFRNYDLKRLENPISTFSFKDGKVEKAHITHVTKLVAESYKLKLNDGNEIIVSENQPFLVYRNGELVWEATKNITSRDFIARLNKINLDEESYNIQIDKLREKDELIEKDGKYTIKSKNLSRSNFITLPKKTSPELLELLGLIISDGNISGKGDSIGFYNNDKDLIGRFEYLMNKVFGINNFKEKKEKKNFGSIVYSKLLVEYFKLIGFSNEKKEVIPPYFFKLPVNEVQSFIRGYFDGDGTVSKMKISNMVYPTPIIYSVDKEFLSQLQSLMLLKIGISTRLKDHNTPKGLMYKLVVRGNEGRMKFLEINPISKHKSERLKEINKVLRVKEHENIPHPSTLIGAIKNLPYKEYRNEDYYVYKTGNATKHSMQVLYEIALKNNLVDGPIKKEFETLMRNDIGWEKVESIESLGKKELFDFTVDKDSFTAAPYFLMHNSKFYGESEKKIRDIFNEAEKTAPAIIFIDEIDAIAPKREDVQGEVERRVVSQLLTMMDGLKTRGKVVVIGATNRPNSLDPALRRPGRFDREVGINVPDKNGRLSILKIHTRNMPLTKDVKLEKLASITHGFVGADLAALAKEAAMSVLRSVLSKIEIRDDAEIPNEVLEKLVISEKDFLEALRIVRPSAMREVLVESPNINWEDVGGLDKVKQELIEAVDWPLQYADAFKRVGIRPPKGILLYGPPGTGKTLLAKAIASESEANFIQVKGPSLLSMWVGKSEEGVRKVFERARQVSPCIIFFDEMDALAPRRGTDTGSKVTERVLNQLLAEMDGLEELQNVVVIGATNRPDMIDPAILRPGRFDRILLVPGPDKEGVLNILKIHTSKMPLGVTKEEIKEIENKLKNEKVNIVSKMAADEVINDKDTTKFKERTITKFKDLSDKDKMLYYIAEKLDGYVGADIENLAREAAMLALRENINIKQIKLKHFEDAMKKVKPSVTKSDMDKYQKIEEIYLKSAKSALLNKTAYLG